MFDSVAEIECCQLRVAQQATEYEVGTEAEGASYHHCAELVLNLQAFWRINEYNRCLASRTGQRGYTVIKMTTVSRGLSRK